MVRGMEAAVRTEPPTGVDAPPADQGPAPRRRLALSPSRASDFKACPLLYRFRAIDRLPEPPGQAQVRGTLVHAVLERMFQRPPGERTPDGMTATLRPTWEELSGERPDWQGLIPDAELAGWLDSAERMVRSYFRLEDPRRFSPEACELAVEIDLVDGAVLRGFIDRLDVAPTGQLRIVDYKTGRSPSEQFESGALYQLKFYALMVYRMRGVVPTQLKLLYLSDELPLVYSPTEDELLSFERAVTALWRAVLAAVRTGDFRPRRSKMCGWCHHQALCPEFGGTPPPYPGLPEEIAALLPA
jgi:putative RecB family exonuclease